MVTVPGQPPQAQDVDLRAAGESRTVRFQFASAPGPVAVGPDGGTAPGPDATVGPGGTEPGTEQGPRRVSVTIRTDPPTKVFIDNRAIGQSPASARIAPGTHSVRCADPGQEINFQTSVRVPDGAPFTTTVAIPRGTLRINGLPWSNVTVNGRALGQTPIAPRQVFAGRYLVRIENPQLGKSQTTSVNVPPGGAGTLAVDWRN
jgi:serine/threonine-protein kinase